MLQYQPKLYPLSFIHIHSHRVGGGGGGGGVTEKYLHPFFKTQLSYGQIEEKNMLKRKFKIAAKITYFVFFFDVDPLVLNNACF